MITVAIGIIEKNGKILIARRNKNDPLKGKWEFPGGQLEPGESPESGLKRELHEELGINAEIGSMAGSSKHAYEHTAVQLLAYRIKDYTGRMNPIEYDEMKWVAPSELSYDDFPEANKPIVKALIRGLP